MPSQYEYGFMFHGIDISQIGSITSEEGNSMFAQELAELTQGLNESLYALMPDCPREATEPSHPRSGQSVFGRNSTGR